MAGETVITVIGGITADPELRYTQSGREVVSFTIASTPRTFNRQTNEWVNGEPLYLRATAWGQLAINISKSLSRGVQVLAQGRLSQHSYQTNSGETRTSTELSIDAIGPSLQFASVVVERSHQSANGSFNNNTANMQNAHSQSMNDHPSQNDNFNNTGNFAQNQQMSEPTGKDIFNDGGSQDNSVQANTSTDNAIGETFNQSNEDANQNSQNDFGANNDVNNSDDPWEDPTESENAPF